MGGEMPAAEDDYYELGAEFKQKIAQSDMAEFQLGGPEIIGDQKFG